MHRLTTIGALLFVTTSLLLSVSYVNFNHRKLQFQSRDFGAGSDHVSKYMRRVGYDYVPVYQGPTVADVENKLYTKKLETNLTKTTENLETLQSQINFMNPFRAFGVYKTLPLETFNAYPGNKPTYNMVYLGIKHNPNYCDIVDNYNLYHSENVYEKQHFVGDYNPNSLVKEHVFNKYGKDVMPETGMGMRNLHKGFLDLDITATAFFTKRVTFHNFYEAGKNFLCASQIYNHIPGHGILTRKDLNVQMVNDYAKRYQSKPQCFNKKMFFPYAYRLDNYTECTEFFEELHSEEYQQRREQEPITFIIKKGYGAHRASGLYMFDEAKEVEIRGIYEEGEKCGEVKKPLLAQYYIDNPLLLDKRNKFDFRIYMLVASVDPMIVYYHDGFLRVSLQSYDKNSTTKSVHFTNTHLSKQLFKLAKSEEEFNGMNETELRDYQMWSMQDLQDYLLDAEIISDENWLDNYLRPQFKQAYLHTVRMAKHSFFKHSGVFEMFGLDFLLDENLNLWFIECNASPQLVGTNEYKTEFLSNMLRDMFEIQYAYLRSRWRRIQKFIRDYSDANSQSKNDLAKWQEKFEKINTNYLEPEFEISPNNSWQKILDENIPGKAAYFGILRDECIDDL